MSGDGRRWYGAISTEGGIETESLFDTTVPTVVVREPQLQARGTQARAQLRSVPLFQLLGFETVVHTDLWDNRFDLVDYDHRAPKEIDDADGLSFPLIHVVTQEGIEEYGEEDLVRRLLERSVDEGGRYVLVTDTAAPKTETYTKKPGKSVVDEFGSITVHDYDHLSSVLIEQHLDSRIPIVETRNVFFHAASTIHDRQDAPAESIDEIFDYTTAPSNSPVWESARYFLEKDLDSVLKDYSDRLREALRSWTERGDTQRAANHILEVLQVCDYDREQFEQYRASPPASR